MILLDTHVWVWIVLKPSKISKAAELAIRRSSASGGLGIATISLWEIAQLIARGTLPVDRSADDWIARLVEETGVTLHCLTPKIAALASQFPETFPKDPADRIIGATARAHAFKLVTSDERMNDSPLLTTIW